LYDTPKYPFLYISDPLNEIDTYNRLRLDLTLLQHLFSFLDYFVFFLFFL